MVDPFFRPCGEGVSALLSSSVHLYTAGPSEFCQLGNGETGERIASAGKLGCSNCAKFVRRSVFVQSESDRDGVARGMMTSGAMDSARKVKCVTLEDAGRIRLSGVSCGRNHLVAVEAPAPGHVPGVFSWGCGDYGCLGHGIQADEYTPRLVGAFRGPVFANNRPVSAVAGDNCTLVLTRNGHAYYVGKRKSTGEATMRPSLVDALANNGHVATCVGAGIRRSSARRGAGSR
jgi:alpha-tubulin suppressor-like RCC1 family protein